MKIVGYSIVYNGSDPDSDFAAAADDSFPVRAAASGSQPQAAAKVIGAIEDAVCGLSQITEADLENCLSLLNPDLIEMQAEVSLAGLIIEDSNIRMFNIGNARVLYFSGGNLKTHTDDHTEAYDNEFDRVRNDPKDYNELRSRGGSRTLKRALGNPDNARLQFYPAIELQRDDAFVICTECFWRYLNPIEMELDYRKAADPEEWLRIMARRVLMKGGRNLDNEHFAVTAIMAE